jgi:glycine betaine/proline transport system permease protein
VEALVIQHLPLGQWVADVIDWLLDTVPWLFDAISAVVQVLVDGLTDALMSPPPVVWLVVFTVLALLLRGLWLALYTLLAFLLVVSLELWVETMQTLALVLVAAVVAVAIGVPLGVLAAQHRAVSLAVRPVLDVMQTTPVFVYLIPAVFFFGVGVVPGVVATILFAIPPGVRLTELGIRQVDREVVEAAQAFGARPGQVLREVQLPLALPSIMAGVNQVIMLALSMVVTAGLLGAAGLGAVVVRAVTQLDVASGVEGGLAVVLLAIFLDRLTAAFGHPTALAQVVRGRMRRAPHPAETEVRPSVGSLGSGGTRVNRAGPVHSGLRVNGYADA